MHDPSLHLLQLSSPALPIGAYAYSQAMEYAIEAGWLEGEALARWLADGLQLGLAQLDLPVLERVYGAAAAGDRAMINTWNDRVLAARETRELLLEDQQLGTALLRLLNSLLEEPPLAPEEKPAYAVAFALAAERWRISVDDALTAYCYSWLENQVAAATKLVPLGQTAAQRLLVQLFGEIPAALAAARTVEDDAIGLSLPGLALASCRHERQHTRLFRS
jgi:urease accessory protein